MITYGLARPEEENDLVDFANYIFSLSSFPTDFKRLHPWIYGRPGFAAITQVAREEQRIKGMISAITGTLRAGNETLQYGYVGTVSTHPYARGQGIMKELMSRTMDDLRRKGCHVAALGGQRQRYQHYGFEDAGSKLTLVFTSGSLRHALGKGPGGRFAFTPIEKAGDAANELAWELHQRADFVCERGRDLYPILLSTWGGQAYAVSAGGEDLGYFYMNGKRVAEFFLKDDALMPEVLADFLAEQRRNDIELALPLCEVGKHPGLFAAAGRWHVSPACMVHVLDWQAFLQALLRYKAQTQRLDDGERVLEITGQGRYRISVRRNQVTVALAGEAADLSLDPMAAVRLCCQVTGGALYPSHPFMNWFPLPFDIPDADAF